MMMNFLVLQNMTTNRTSALTGAHSTVSTIVIYMAKILAHRLGLISGAGSPRNEFYLGFVDPPPKLPSPGVPACCRYFKVESKH
jgi:hypothetical protein